MTSLLWAATRAHARAAVVVLSAAGLGAGACGGETPAPPVSSGALGTTAADLDRDIFQPGCAFGACHGATRPAARLNLGGGICDARLARPSCLFPGKQLIVPGHPEQSFLIDKLTGENLAPMAETDCSTTGNARMPYGGAALSAATIERVRTWIRDGAKCAALTNIGGTGVGGGSGMTVVGPGGSSGSGGDGGGVGGSSGWRLGFDSAAVHVRSGARATMTLTITPAAGSTGVSVVLSPGDATALAVPGAVYIPAGSDRVTFDVQGKRPSPAVHLTATAGDARTEAAVAVDGLYIAEVFYGGAPVPSPGDHSQWVKLVNVTDAPIDLTDYQVIAGRGGAADTTLPLAGVLESASCLVVGGPASTTGDFSPDIPRVDPSQPGVAVAVGPASPPAGAPSAVPLDAMLAGGNAVVVGADGSTLTAAVASVAAGHSLVRTGAGTWADQAAPTPSDCRRWW